MLDAVEMRKIELLKTDSGVAGVMRDAPARVSEAARARGIHCLKVPGFGAGIVLVNGNKAVLFKGTEALYADNRHSRHNDKYSTKIAL